MQSRPKATKRRLKDGTDPLPVIRATHHEGSFAEFKLTLDNQIVPGSNPLPPPDADPNVDPKYRRVLINTTGLIVDHDTLSFNDEATPDVHLEIEVNPWNRIASAAHETCVDNEVVGAFVPEVRLLDDLETVRVTLTAQVFEGTSCPGSRCGQATKIVDVPRDATVRFDVDADGNPVPRSVRATCQWIPYLAPENDTYAEFGSIVVTNTLGTPP